jgi:hypothetical protein
MTAVTSFLDRSEQELSGLPGPLRAMWHAAHGDWNAAHGLVQDDPSLNAAWVHAYLHRVEGDLGNARYWYHRAGKQPVFELSLDLERDQLIEALINSVSN